MRIKVRFFGLCRELAGLGQKEIDVDEGATVTYLKEMAVTDLPQLKNLSYLIVVVNGNYVEEHFSLSQGDEVALLPPLSGG